MKMSDLPPEFIAAYRQELVDELNNRKKLLTQCKGKSIEYQVRELVHHKFTDLNRFDTKLVNNGNIYL